MDAKQEMMKNLNETLAFVGQEAKTGMTFLKEQAPLVVQEYLRWELMSSLCLAGFGVLLLLAAYVGYRMFKYAYSQHFRDWTEALGVFFGGGGPGDWWRRRWPYNDLNQPLPRPLRLDLPSPGSRGLYQTHR